MRIGRRPRSAVITAPPAGRHTSGPCERASCTDVRPGAQRISTIAQRRFCSSAQTAERASVYFRMLRVTSLNSTSRKPFCAVGQRTVHSADFGKRASATRYHASVPISITTNHAASAMRMPFPGGAPARSRPGSSDASSVSARFGFRSAQRMPTPMRLPKSTAMPTLSCHFATASVPDFALTQTRKYARLALHTNATRRPPTRRTMRRMTPNRRSSPMKSAIISVV